MEDSKGKIDLIERCIEMEGDLDAKQKQRLLEIADRCPVHRTLHGKKLHILVRLFLLCQYIDSIRLD